MGRNGIAQDEHRREGLRYPSDLADVEWVLIASLPPGPRPGGQPRTTSLRDVIEAILYMASSGFQWRKLPNDFPSVSTVQGYFYAWRDKTTESGGVSGYDASKKIEERKRHIMTDTLGLMLVAAVHSPAIQDRDGAPPGLTAVATRLSRVRHVFADGSYAGDKLREALRPLGAFTLEERSIENSTAWTFIASIRMLSRRVAGRSFA